MAFRDDIVALAQSKPIELRDALTDTEVLKALRDIGILPKVLELHAPSTQSRKSDGLGAALCGRNGTRHRIVTCKQCQKGRQ